jgi:hypothetical protein
MPWSYHQATGQMLFNRSLIATAYSGHGPGLNNPAMQSDHDVGPIPVGTYTIGPAHYEKDKGPIVMGLTPDPSNRMFGRVGLLIHGDNPAMDHSASLGCIILGPAIRKQISGSADRTLIVTAS